MDLSRSNDSPLFVGGTVNIEGLERQNQSGWKEEMLDEGGINEISCGSAVYEGGGGNGSHSIL